MLIGLHDAEFATFNVKYLKKRIDFDKFIGLIRVSNFFFSCMFLLVAIIAFCIK